MSSSPHTWDALLRDLRDDEETPPQPLPPKIGKYDILRAIGTTRSSTVYLAADPDLGRKIAIKVLREERALPEFVRRFEREGSFTATLRHPGLIAIHELGRWIEPGKPTLPYIVMDYHEGGTLAGRRMAPAQAAQVVAAAAQALDHAHRHGVIHRDLKPENILLDTSGQPVISDFGLALDLDASTRETHAGTLLGTPRYMAPEQIEGDSQKIGVRTDVYGLGAILYELLTGQPPFSAPSATSLFHHILSEAPRPPSSLMPEISGPLDAIVLEALEKDPGRRYPTAWEFGEDLGRYLRGEPVHARRPVRRQRRQVWIAGGLAGLAALGLALAVGSPRKESAGPPVESPATQPPAPARWVELGGSAAGGGVSHTPAPSFECCVILDESERPVVAWREYAGGGGIWLRRFGGSRWEDLGRSASGGGFGASRRAESPKLARGQGGHLFLSWDEDASGHAQVFFLEWDGSEWKSIGDSGSGTGVSRSSGYAKLASLAADREGRPLLAWQDSSSGRFQIYLRRYDGGSWAELGGSATGGGLSASDGACSLPSLAVDPAGRPAVAYLERVGATFSVRLAKWDGKSWARALDPPGSAVRPNGEAGWNSDRLSLSFDSKGRAHLAWSSGPPGHSVIRFALYDGFAWQELGGSATDHAVSGTSNAGDVCLSVDRLDRPTIVWTDWDTPGIHLKRWNGAAWEELAGSASGGGLCGTPNPYTGGAWVTLGSTGNPVVAWNQHLESPGNDEIYLKQFAPAKSDRR